MKASFANVGITCISAELPKHEVTMASFSAQFGAEEVQRIVASTGVEAVRYAQSGECSSDLCYSAALRLLEQTGTKPDEIDALLFVTQTPDYKIPGNSFLLQARLGLRSDALCIDLPAGCSGFIYGLFHAAAYVQIGTAKKVLLLVGETNSKLIDQNDRSLRMVFGDAGTASLIEKTEGSMSFDIRSEGKDFEALYVKAGAARYPNASEAETYLSMDGMEVMNFALREVPEMVGNMLQKTGWEAEETLFGLHQANAFMLNYLRKKMKLPEANMPIKLGKTGNTGAASIPLMLSQLTENDTAFKNLNQSLLCGFGVGLSWAACATDLSKTKLIFKS